jgi:hypothetical protein
MGRFRGAPNRAPQDRVMNLFRREQEIKKARSADGCAVCGRFQGEPRHLIWAHRDRETADFRISQGPRIAKMTRERLEAEIDKCRLVCRACNLRALGGNPAPKMAVTTRDEAQDLDIYLGEHVAGALASTDPAALLLRGTLYVKAT